MKIPRLSFPNDRLLKRRLLAPVLMAVMCACFLALGISPVEAPIELLPAIRTVHKLPCHKDAHQSFHKLVAGARSFHTSVFPSRKVLFKDLSKGQHPQVLFITCCDSRIDPNLITQTSPGQMFVYRNIGNIVPPANGQDSTQAAIEYAVKVLGVKDIVVCGHSHCGAMAELISPSHHSKSLPGVQKWLTRNQKVKEIIHKRYGHLPAEHMQTLAAQENVLVQMENLLSYPDVKQALSSNALQIHGWVYVIESGQIHDYDTQKGQFISLTRPHQLMNDIAPLQIASLQ